MPILGIVGGVLVLVAVLGLFRYLQARRHGKQMESQAERLGLSYTEEGDARAYARAGRFMIFSQGGTGELQHLMQGEVRPPDTEIDGDAVKVEIFEYTFLTPLGRYAENWRQTVIRLEDETLDLPTFSIMPEPVFNAMVKNARSRELREQLLGTAGVRAPDHPEFNEAMHVQGPDRSAVQSLLSEELIAFYGGSNVLCIEGSGRYLLFYRYDHIVEPKGIGDFLDRALEAYVDIKKSQEQVDENGEGPA